jgi:hypothetical protein
VSLILEALRKLDREKQVQERGFLVMAPAAWPSRDSAGRRWGWLLLTALAVGIGALAWLGRTPGKQAAEAPQPIHTAAPAVPTPAPAHAAPFEGPATTLPRQPAPMAATPAPVVEAQPAPALAAPAIPGSQPAAAAAPARGFVLQAITERDGRPLAMINDRMLREGDEIDGARLVKIGDTFVEIDYQGRRTTLHF